ncbi:Hypothetical protein SMAX5B_003396 [Scophthalmus maximus]|uniref:Uncharacterized protein n=1 Tax=Scophthalmus maximus TaxID=52904 RepID=A0A2U9CLB6_SCOMX|nr:Hypothetical protein SMAX5B_003396 [Scophthalmus maximus]
MQPFKHRDILYERDEPPEREAALLAGFPGPSDVILKDRLRFPFASLRCFGASKRPTGRSERTFGFSSRFSEPAPSSAH